MSRWYVGAILEPSWNIQPVICLRDYSRFSVGATWCPADTTNHIRPLPCFYLGHCTADISTFCSNSWGKKKVGCPLVELTTYPPSQSHFLLRFPLHRHSPHIRFDFYQWQSNADNELKTPPVKRWKEPNLLKIWYIHTYRWLNKRVIFSILHLFTVLLCNLLTLYLYILLKKSLRATKGNKYANAGGSATTSIWFLILICICLSLRRGNNTKALKAESIFYISTSAGLDQGFVKTFSTLSFMSVGWIS